MNENIKNLIENIDTDTSGRWISVGELEKLANLIVLECATIADIDDKNPAGCGYITKTKGMLIRAHFGVKE